MSIFVATRMTSSGDGALTCRGSARNSTSCRSSSSRPRRTSPRGRRRAGSRARAGSPRSCPATRLARPSSAAPSRTRGGRRSGACSPSAQRTSKTLSCRVHPGVLLVRASDVPLHHRVEQARFADVRAAREGDLGERGRRQRRGVDRPGDELGVDDAGPARFRLLSCPHLHALHRDGERARRRPPNAPPHGAQRSPRARADPSPHATPKNTTANARPPSARAARARWFRPALPARRGAPLPSRRRPRPPMPTSRRASDGAISAQQTVPIRSFRPASKSAICTALDPATATLIPDVPHRPAQHDGERDERAQVAR